MIISALQAWLEVQKALHGDVDVICISAFENAIEGDVLTVEELDMTILGKLGLIREGLEKETRVVVAVEAL